MFVLKQFEHSIFIYIHVYVYCIHICVCIYVFICIYVYVRIYIHMHFFPLLLPLLRMRACGEADICHPPEMHDIVLSPPVYHSSPSYSSTLLMGPHSLLRIIISARDRGGEKKQSRVSPQEGSSHNSCSLTIPSEGHTGRLILIPLFKLLFVRGGEK